MKKSFLKNYIKIYFWLTISLILNFLSMFVVTPMLTGNSIVYGVYMLCISSTIFLSYADIGFVGAGYKFASESYARGEHKEVIKIIGFVTAILLVFVLLYSILMFIFSWYPAIIVKNILPGYQFSVARRLFLILGCFSPIIILQRSLQIIFGIRLEDYVFQRINILGNIIKICSVFYFFHNGQYNIVGYFLFTQIINAVCAIISLIIARFRYEYKLLDLLKAIKISREYYTKLKSLAFSSILLTFSWVLFNEMDPFAISRILGADKFAVYAIGLTLMTFLRNLFGIIFNPFSARFNHFVGINDIAGLRALFLKVLQMTLPITIIPLMALELFLKPFIYCWVGSAYQSSVVIGSILLISYVFVFVSSPSAILLIALKRIKENNILSLSTTALFWTGILLSVRAYGVYSFAMCKTLVFVVFGLYYLRLALKFLGKNYSYKLFTESVLPLFIPAVILVVCAHFAGPHLPNVKDKIELLKVLGVLSLCSGFAIIVYAAISPAYHQFIKSTLSRLSQKKQYVRV